MKYSDVIPELPARVSKQTPAPLLSDGLAVPETSSERKTSVKNRKDFSSGTPGERTIPTTCIEHAYGGTFRLSFQIKVF